MTNIKKFETYLEKITDSLDLGSEVKEELKEEWQQHLIDIMNSFTKKGKSTSEAIDLAIKQFGDANLLKYEVQKTFLNSREMHLLKEMIIWIICMVAASVGPVFLINAHYSILFFIAPLILLSICYYIFHFVVRRLDYPTIWKLGLPLLYGSFVFFVSQQISFEYFLRQLLLFYLNGDGLFTISIIHLFWLVMMAKTIISNLPNKQKRLTMLRSSFEYWIMVMAGIVFVVTEVLTSSGEGKTILLNIFLLYGFFQQLIDPNFLIKSKNIVGYWLKG